MVLGVLYCSSRRSVPEFVQTQVRNNLCCKVNVGVLICHVYFTIKFIKYINRFTVELFRIRNKIFRNSDFCGGTIGHYQ